MREIETLVHESVVVGLQSWPIPHLSEHRCHSSIQDIELSFPLLEFWLADGCSDEQNVG